MLDHITPPSAESVLNDGDKAVRDSAHRLFERLNPRDRGIESDFDALAIYDWEIAADTAITLGDVRSSLRLLDGSAVVVGVVNSEHRVTALAS